MVMKALVTGGAGFIGSNLVDALLDKGATVDVVDNLSTGRYQNLHTAMEQGARFHEADVSDAAAIAEIMAEAAPDIVFHLAAQIDVRRAVVDPAFDARVNIGGTVAVLEAARSAGVQRFVFTSTGGALYGDAKLVPTAEDAAIQPLAPYGTSKAAAESYCALYSRLYDLSTISLRLANVYGPRQDPRGEAGVIAIFCGIAKNGRSAPIYGDGQQTRDYVYVGDVVAAFLAAAESRESGSFNIGTAHEYKCA